MLSVNQLKILFKFPYQNGHKKANELIRQVGEQFLCSFWRTIEDDRQEKKIRRIKMKTSFLAAIIAIIAISFLNEISCDDAKLLESIPTSPSRMNINQICEGIFFEPRPFESDKKFFIGCIRGEGVIFQCFENEIFDNEMLRCVYDSETPSTVPIDTSSLPQITTEDPALDEVCENLFFDFIEHPFDCGLLIFCYQETPIIRECPPNQIFHIETLQCRSGNRETCEFYYESTTLSTTTPADIDGICDGFIFHFIPHPTDCGLAIFCYEELPIVRECPPGEIFDTRVDNCRPGDRETCTLFPSSSPSNYCEGQDEGALIAHAIDSRKFYLCAAGKNAILLQCEDNKMFDDEKSLCVTMSQQLL